MPIIALRSTHHINAVCFQTIYVKIEVRERFLQFFMPQLLDVHVSENTNTEKVYIFCSLSIAITTIEVILYPFIHIKFKHLFIPAIFITS